MEPTVEGTPDPGALISSSAPQYMAFTSTNAASNASSPDHSANFTSTLHVTLRSTMTPPAGTAQWTSTELHLLGAFLWLAVLGTLLGNLSCFYAVVRNIRKILEHPFFQSNIFCLYLSALDVVMVVLVGMPAAFCYTTKSAATATTMQGGAYNKAVVNVILDYIAWVQLLLVVAICVDRAGHICLPLQYSFSIKPWKTAVACIACTLIPFLAMVVPYLFVLSVLENPTFDCQYSSSINMDHHSESSQVFLSCEMTVDTVQLSGVDVFKMWENIFGPLTLGLTITALVISNALTISRILEGQRFHNTEERRTECQRAIKTNCLVSTGQAILILVSTLPFRYYQIDNRFTHQGDKYNQHFIVISRALIFLGPTFNPWLYPIRMASIRGYLNSQKSSMMSSVSRQFSRLKSAAGSQLELHRMFSRPSQHSQDQPAIPETMMTQTNTTDNSA